MSKFDVPILILAFNRPKYTRVLFNKLKELEPTRLYIVCDGPRFDNKYDFELCKATKNIFEEIDWKCDLHKLYREINLGCKYSVKYGIDWFFSKVEFGIILEDDCIPNLSFFNYCERMLKNYEPNKEIFQISGTSYLNENLQFNNYFYSNISPIWGWATWKDRWEKLEFEKMIINNENFIEKIQTRYPNKVYINFVVELIKNVNNYKVSSWATYWLYSIIKNNGISILPGKNLVENIGIIGNSFEKGKKGNVNKRKTFNLNIETTINKTIAINQKLDDSQLLFLEKNIIDDEKTNAFVKSKTIIIDLIQKFKSKIINVSFKIIKFLLGIIKLSVVKNQKNTITKNLFNTNFSKTALVSFTKEFIKKENYNHTIYKERDTLIQILKENHFNVDIIDYRQNCYIDFQKYNLVIGFGYAFENAINSKANCVTVFYANGSNPDFSNSSGIKKITHKYNNDLITSVRISDIPYHKSVYFSKYRIILGNDVVKSTYPEAKTNFNLNAFFYKTLDVDFEIKDFKSAKNHFLWFGGGGALHKGLDLLLEIFSKRDDIFLHICGLTKNEVEFVRYFENEMKSKNILNYGFLDIKSNLFRELMYKCAFTIMPSISEGGAVSTLTTMGNGGLIPIISKNTGLDVNGFGYIHENNQLEDIENVINTVLSLSEKDIINKSNTCLSSIENEYNYNQYKCRLESIMKKII